MKTPHPYHAPADQDWPCPRSRGERGSITLVFVILLTVMMILIAAESSALWRLHREVKFLEQQQIKRLNHSPANAAANTTTRTP